MSATNATSSLVMGQLRSRQCPPGPGAGLSIATPTVGPDHRLRDRPQPCRLPAPPEKCHPFIPQRSHSLPHEIPDSVRRRWNCPYGVPQYNPDRGGVGKVRHMLQAGDGGTEPACVKACPVPLRLSRFGIMAFTGAGGARTSPVRASARPYPSPPEGSTMPHTRGRVARSKSTYIPRPARISF